MTTYATETEWSDEDLALMNDRAMKALARHHEHGTGELALRRGIARRVEAPAGYVPGAVGGDCTVAA